MILVITEIKKYRGIVGYGRTIINADERIIPIMNKVEKLGFKNGTCIKLAFEIEKSLSTPLETGHECGRSISRAISRHGLKAQRALPVYDHLFFGRHVSLLYRLHT